MIDIQAGDVVVCVDAGECACGCSFRSPLKVGALYRVTAIVPDEYGIIGLTLREVPTPGTHTGFDVAFFRKIRPATKKFTTQIKAIRPIKQREEA